MINPEIKRLQMRLMNSADPLSGVRLRCNEIRDRVKNINLPKLSLDEITKLKQHLIEYNKIKDNDIKYRFLNLRNAFLIINEMEDDEQLKTKILPILQFLSQFKFVFDMIIENQGKKQPQKLDLVMQLLNFEIELFCIKYGRMLVDTDVGSLPFREMKKIDTNIDELGEDIEEGTEELMPEAMMPEEQPDEYEQQTEQEYRGEEYEEDQNS